MVKFIKTIVILSSSLIIGLVACNDEAPSPSQPPIVATPIPIEEPVVDPLPDDGDGISLDILNLDNCLAFASCSETNMSVLSADEQNEVTGFHNVMKASQIADPSTITDSDKNFCKQKIDKFTESLSMCPLPTSFGTLSDD